MSLATRALRLAVVAASLGSVALIGHATAAPGTTKLYFGSVGCPASDTWLDTVVTKNPDDGCGYAGGLPLDEAAGATPNDYTTKKTVKPMRIDGSKKVTGVFAVGSWFAGTVGVGQVSIDISMTAKTKAGKTINFGQYTATATASPATVDHVDMPFTFTVPKTANGQILTKITFTVSHAGKNLGWNADDFSGDSYANIPTK